MQYYSTLVSGSKDKSVMYKVTKSLLGRSSDTPLPDHSCKSELANSFNSFFVDKIDKIQLDIDRQRSHTSVSEDPVFTADFLRRFSDASCDEIKKILT